jgi:hypothetical protein
MEERMEMELTAFFGLLEEWSSKEDADLFVVRMFLSGKRWGLFCGVDNGMMWCGGAGDDVFFPFT